MRTIGRGAHSAVWVRGDVPRNFFELTCKSLYFGVFWRRLSNFGAKRYSGHSILICVDFLFVFLLLRDEEGF